jgi:hypothetical protein
MAKITWNEAAIRKLKACCEATIDCDGQLMAATLNHVAMWMDTTPAAISSAIHRFGLILGQYEVDEHGHIATVKLRSCKSCAETFGSRGIHNRLCKSRGGVGNGKHHIEREREREAA